MGGHILNRDVFAQVFFDIFDCLIDAVKPVHEIRHPSGVLYSKYGLFACHYVQNGVRSVCRSPLRSPKKKRSFLCHECLLRYLVDPSNCKPSFARLTVLGAIITLQTIYALSTSRFDNYCLPDSYAYPFRIYYAIVYAAHFAIYYIMIVCISQANK